MKVFTAPQMRAFDKAATEEYGIPSIALMENAALRVVEFLEAKFAPLAGKRVAILCGKGNNGGDGLAIARHLLAAGCRVQVSLSHHSSALKGDARVNYLALQAALLNYDDDEFWIDEPDEGVEYLEIIPGRYEYDDNDIIVDALLGTGFKGEVDDSYLANLFRHLCLSPARKVAVDIPSGVNADTGEASLCAAAVDYTVTLAAPKPGLLLREGLELSGEVWVGAIGTPPAMEAIETGSHCLTRQAARRLLPHRRTDAHKGDAGRVVLVGGSYGMSGAPTLAARAVLRSGAGLCIAALPDKIMPTFGAAFSEATSHPLPCDKAGQLTSAAVAELEPLWKTAHAVALGPGLSRGAGALDFARRVVRTCPHPLIIDADALYALRAVARSVKARKAPTILTPHPGEMGELMNLKTSDVQADRVGTAIACAAKYNAIVVLKGARSIIALPEGLTWFNLTGNSGMATGGSGDVLTGTIAGLLAQLKDAVSATLLGVYLHGLAGDIAYETKGNGLIAGDIAEALPAALRRVESDDVPGINARLVRLA